MKKLGVVFFALLLRCAGCGGGGSDDSGPSLGDAGNPVTYDPSVADASPPA
jgi:hypothetical protein